MTKLNLNNRNETIENQTFFHGAYLRITNFASIYFRELKKLHFADINFRELKKFRFFASVNFPNWSYFKFSQELIFAVTDF